MSGGTFAVVLACGAAVLALWLNARAPSVAPYALSRLLVHVVTALVLTHLIPAGGDSVAFAFVVVFAAALPVLVSAFLVAIWMIRFFQGAPAAFR